MEMTFEPLARNAVELRDHYFQRKDERDWGTWKRSYRARTRGESIRFVPLHQIGDERYTVYFRVAPAGSS